MVIHNNIARTLRLDGKVLSLYLFHEKRKELVNRKGVEFYSDTTTTMVSFIFKRGYKQHPFMWFYMIMSH